MTSSERILYIDDEAAIRRAFLRSLHADALTIDLADRAEIALMLARRRPYAVIACDYRLAGTNGLELMAQIQPLQPDASYILITGCCDLKLAVEAVNNYGCTAVITKPWETTELSSLLRRGIEAYAERSLLHRVERSTVATTNRLEQQRYRLQEQLDCSEEMMAEMLLSALDLRDHETRNHCRRVAAYSRTLAEHLGIHGPDLISIQHGALLHDIGKIGVPDSILLKPGPLTEDEWVVMRRHAELGHQMLAKFDALNGARDIVAQHHERWDGSGYPLGLAGEKITRGARIFAVADALDAMLSERPYRHARPLNQALAVIVSERGRQFDPVVVDCLTQIPQFKWTEARQCYPDQEDESAAAQTAA